MSKKEKEFLICECGKPFNEHKPFNDEGKKIYICPNNISGFAPSCYKRKKPDVVVDREEKDVNLRAKTNSVSSPTKKMVHNDLQKGKSKCGCGDDEYMNTGFCKRHYEMWKVIPKFIRKIFKNKDEEAFASDKEKVKGVFFEPFLKRIDDLINNANVRLQDGITLGLTSKQINEYKVILAISGLIKSDFLFCLEELNKVLIKEETKAKEIYVNVSIAYSNARMYVKKIMGDKK